MTAQLSSMLACNSINLWSISCLYATPLAAHPYTAYFSQRGQSDAIYLCLRLFDENCQKPMCPGIWSVKWESRSHLLRGISQCQLCCSSTPWVPSFAEKHHFSLRWSSILSNVHLQRATWSCISSAPCISSFLFVNKKDFVDTKFIKQFECNASNFYCRQAPSGANKYP
jgi:hypothetical protein